MSIGILTSISFTGTFETAFKIGLGTFSGTPLVKKEAKGAYNADGSLKDLYDMLQELIDDASVNVIVTAGGLVAAHAALHKKCKKPFLVVVGNTPNFELDPNDPDYAYCGGVNLNTVSQNSARHDFLVSIYGVSPNKVCLIFNPKSRMHSVERNEWVYRNWPFEPVVKNDVSEFAKAFTKAKAKAQAVVVSGDPFFTNKRNDFVTAANNSNLIVCYPFEAYATATPPPTPGSAMWYGPKLDIAYRTIGNKVAQILTELALGHAAPFTGLDTLAPPAPTQL